MIIGFKRLSENAILPTKANATDSGWDLYVAEDVIIAPGETVVVKTDIAVKLPKGFGATIRPRSGVTSKTKLRVQLGTIDNAYIGNVGIIVDNTADLGPHSTIGIWNLYGGLSDIGRLANCHSYLIQKGDKLAQLVLERTYDAEAVEIFELEATERGSNGFGSSGYGVNK